MEKAKKKKWKVNWVELFFGILWFVGAMLIFVLYQTDNLSETIQVPKLVSWVYEIFGVTVGSIIQFVISLGLIFTSVKKVKQ